MTWATHVTARTDRLGRQITGVQDDGLMLRTEGLGALARDFSIWDYRIKMRHGKLGDLGSKKYNTSPSYAMAYSTLINSLKARASETCWFGRYGRICQVVVQVKNKLITIRSNGTEYAIRKESKEPPKPKEQIDYFARAERSRKTAEARRAEKEKALEEQRKAAKAMIPEYDRKERFADFDFEKHYKEKKYDIASIDHVGGVDKDGNPEMIICLTLKKGVENAHAG